VLRLFTFIVAAFVVAAPQSAGAAAAPTTRPNIVVILADDMGFSDLGCYGGEIATPNIDRLAAGGVRMTQFYNNARCCPTRASLLTGLYPHQAGVGAMCQDLGQPGYRGELNRNCVTIAEVLGANGYETAMVGKWHLSHLTISAPDKPAPAKKLLNYEADAPISPGGATDTWPFKRGFQEMWGTIAGVNNFYDPYSLVHNDTPITPPPARDFYYTDFITQKSAEVIDRSAKSGDRKPLFMYVAYTAPHWPLHAPDEAAIKRYELVYAKGWDAIRKDRYERLVRLGIIKREWAMAPRETDAPKHDPAVAWDAVADKQWEIRRMAVYAAQVEAMDRGIGKILDALDRNKMADDTLVLFLSDNGACAENVQAGWYDIPGKTRDGRAIKVGNDDKSVMAGAEETFMSYGPVWANVSNTPFRSYKHFTHEGGIAAPFIARWPAKKLREGQLDRETVGHVIDVMPMCLEAAGAEYPKTFGANTITPMEGRTRLRDGAGAERLLFWEHEGNRAVRVGNWKLVAPNGQPWQLYDLDADRTEQHNVASQNAAKVSEMSKLYDEWATRCGVLPWPVKLRATTRE
jgi:arylsulfatase